MGKEPPEIRRGPSLEWASSVLRRRGACVNVKDTREGSRSRFISTVERAGVSSLRQRSGPSTVRPPLLDGLHRRYRSFNGQKSCSSSVRKRTYGGTPTGLASIAITICLLLRVQRLRELTGSRFASVPAVLKLRGSGSRHYATLTQQRSSKLTYARNGVWNRLGIEASSTPKAC